MNINLQYSTPQSEIFFNNPAKFNIIPKGKRLGLTRGAAQAMCEYALEGITPMLWGDTVNGNIDRYYEMYFLPVLKQIGSEYYKWNQQKHQLKIFNSVIDFRSADRPENWEGFGYRVIILNEAGIILKDDYLYKNAVLPMMIDYPDSILIASGVPKGKMTKNGDHMFYVLSEKAKDDTTGRYKYLHYTSYDNPFLQRAEIEAMENELDPESAKQEIHGEFLDTSIRPFMYCFDKDIHVRECTYKEGLPVYLSFDFNVDPCTCLIWQEGFIEQKEWIHYIDEVYLFNSNIYEVCEKIKVGYPGAHFMVTGDATGRSRSALVKGRTNYYVVIKQELGIKDMQFKIPSVNPPVADNRVLCNSILSHHEGLKIDPKCKELINDLKYVEVTEFGEINKSNAHRSHLLDGWRYSLNTFHHNFLKNV